MVILFQTDWSTSALICSNTNHVLWKRHWHSFPFRLTIFYSKKKGSQTKQANSEKHSLAGSAADCWIIKWSYSMRTLKYIGFVLLTCFVSSNQYFNYLPIGHLSVFHARKQFTWSLDPHHWKRQTMHCIKVCFWRIKIEWNPNNMLIKWDSILPWSPS